VPLRLVPIPGEGIYRVDRWADLYEFRSPSESLEGQAAPVNYGERWEDFYAGFGTLKLSASEHAAVGRTVARYRRRFVDGHGFVDFIKRQLIAEPDAGQAIEPDNRIPRSYFEDTYLIGYGQSIAVEFVDLEHPATHETLAPLISDQLALFGLQGIPADVTRNRDRRVTRLLTSVLRNLCGSVPEYQHVAGFRYSGRETQDWDAYVLWDPAALDLEEDPDLLRPLTPGDEAVLRAARELSLDWPA